MSDDVDAAKRCYEAFSKSFAIGEQKGKHGISRQGAVGWDELPLGERRRWVVVAMAARQS